MKELLFVAGKNCLLSEEMQAKVALFEELNPDIKVTRLFAGKDEDVFAQKTDGYRFSSTPAFAAIEDGIVLDRHEGKVCEVRLLRMFTGETPSLDTSNVPVSTAKDRLIFFSGSWCVYCKQMDEVLAKFLREDQDFEFLKLDVEEDAALVPPNCYHQEINGVPNFFWIKDGAFVRSHAGMMTVQQLEEFIS